MAKKRPTKSATGKTASAGETSTSARLWGRRILDANKDYDEWAKEYEVARLARYYLGRQWEGLSNELARKKYVINLVFATLETQLPSLMFSKPKVTVEPRPSRQYQPGSESPGRANLLEATLQTFVDKPELQFTYETTLALRSAYTRFGLIEVGYTADFLDNPNVDKPVLKEDTDDPLLDEQDEPITQPGRIPTEERLYLKRVPPHTFRAMPGRNQLGKNDYVMYYEYAYVEDVKANKDYVNTEDLKATGTSSTDTESDSERDRDPDNRKHAGMVKIWRIWDLRQKMRHVYAEGHPKLLQENKPFKYLPLAVLKFYEIDDSFYPLPPIFNMLSPQDEVNETREMQKVHRRRGLRRYMRLPQVSKTEFEKLETGEDMVCIEVPQLDSIAPIPDADLSRQNSADELLFSLNDFNRVAGVSGEAQGVPQSDTATQANIINVREQIRESRARTLVGTWLAEIVRLMMLTIREKMQLPMVVKMNVDPFAPPVATEDGEDPTAAAPPETAAERDAAEWKQIEREDLGSMDYDVKVDLASLSPVAEDAQRAQWNVVLQLLTNPALATLLFMPNPLAPNEPSPMLRKTLWLNGVKSDADVREIWRIGQAVLKAAADAAKQQQDSDKAEQARVSINYGIKGDMSNPLVMTEFIKATAQQAVAQAMAAAKQPAQVPPPDEGGAGGVAPLVKAAPAPITGTPAPGPSTGG